MVEERTGCERADSCAFDEACPNYVNCAPPWVAHYRLDLVPMFDLELRRHFWVIAGAFPVGPEDIAACRRGEPVLLRPPPLRVSGIHCAYCGIAPDRAGASPEDELCTGKDHDA